MKILTALKGIDEIPEPTGAAQEFKYFGFKKALDALFFVFPVRSFIRWMRFTMYPEIIEAMASGLRTDNGFPIELRPGEEKPVYIVEFHHVPSEKYPRMVVLKAAKTVGQYHYRPFEKVLPDEPVHDFFQFFHDRETISADLAKFIVLYQSGALNDKTQTQTEHSHE